MINVFISFFMMILSFNFFGISYQLNGVNRAFTSIPISIFETSIPLNTAILYFDKVKLENQLTSYLDCSISKYTSNYQIKYVYLNSNNDTFCVSNNCDKILITLNASLSFSIKYEKSMNFTIWSR